MGVGKNLSDPLEPAMVVLMTVVVEMEVVAVMAEIVVMVVEAVAEEYGYM